MEISESLQLARPWARSTSLFRFAAIWARLKRGKRPQALLPSSGNCRQLQRTPTGSTVAPNQSFKPTPSARLNSRRYSTCAVQQMNRRQPSKCRRFHRSAGRNLVAALRSRPCCLSGPPANFALLTLRVRRLRVEGSLPNWQNGAMGSGGAFGLGGFSKLAFRPGFPTAPPWLVPSLQAEPFAKAPRRIQPQSLRPENMWQSRALWNPHTFNIARAITKPSTRRRQTLGPAKPGWLWGGAG